MPKQLQEKVIAWQNKIEENKSIYENVVSIQRTLLDELTALDGELNVLEGELKALVDVQSVQIAGNNNEGLSDTYIKIEKKEKKLLGDAMNEYVYLKVPEINELHYRQKWMWKIHFSKDNDRAIRVFWRCNNR